MSYILDALKRADAERERGHVPGLHSQPNSPRQPTSVTTRRRLWPWIALVLALLLAVGSLRWLESAPPLQADLDTDTSSATEAIDAPRTDPAAREATPAPMPTTAPPPAPAPILAPSAPPPRSATRVRPPNLPAEADIDTEEPRGTDVEDVIAVDAPPPVALPDPVVTPRPAARAPLGTQGRPVMNSAPQVAPARPIEPIVNSRTDIRISGSTWSDDPAMRMLIINGQVVREGQSIAPGLQLETIGRRTAIFNERGSRFNLDH